MVASTRGTWAGLGRTSFAAKAFRYATASLFNVALGESIIAIGFGILHWTAQTSTVVATLIATGPAYLLNRMWVWKKTGPSHLVREVVPFWALAFVGLLLSTWAAERAHLAAQATGAGHTAQAAVVMCATLAAFGVIWVARFIVLDTLLFAHDGNDPSLAPHDHSA